eukprot:CAMPEP_0175945012 /NCGR_PEP_ID=MMETSP0108-20121206/26464_1 /TAXON_ID=195067 ORGANISM="Goniomonas pacifica, Strain CCMP1869" /NCGR_SAMPLE_ID=MMETSP0108 /ASSEMBLY_ACC=CAM_ASM_000204 /LENGTH=416 /DNA_ID=CAMNT_0017270225 /DNA_START=1 /DNA_END=1251 /DNA_ORIENTATION=-
MSAACRELEEALERIGGVSEQRQRITEYKTLLSDLVQKGDAEVLEVFTNHIVAERIPVVVSRQVLQELSTVIFTSSVSVITQKKVAMFLLEKLRPRVSSFEEVFAHTTEKLSEIFETEEDWRKAAELLREVPLTSGLRQLSDDYKAEKYIKIAQLFLECDEPVEAEAFVNRATAIIHKCTHPRLKFSHQACRARILDSQRRFLDSARHYYELSQLDKAAVMAIDGTTTVDETALEQQNLMALHKAVICAILAPAGPQRSRVLAMMYKDERSAGIDVYHILQKIYMDRILRREEVDKFTQGLDSHHKAMTSSGVTVVEHAIIEHNMLAAAKLYNNITFLELGSLLGIDASKAERTASVMIGEERMSGSIDQVNNMLHFEQDPEQVRQMDTAVEGMCTRVNAIISHISAKHPTFIGDA